MAAKQFEELEVWKTAKATVVTVYRLTAKPPVSRDFGFRDQIQRAAISAMSNIAEGFERGGNRELVHFLYMAKGSAAEVRSLAYVAAELGYIAVPEKEELLEKTSSIGRQLGGFIGYLERDLSKRTDLRSS